MGVKEINSKEDIIENIKSFKEQERNNNLNDFGKGYLMGLQISKQVYECESQEQKDTDNNCNIGGVISTVCPVCFDKKAMNHKGYNKSTCVKCGFQWQTDL